MSENDMTLSQEELRKSEPQAVEKPEAATEPAEVQEAPVTEAQEEPAETDVPQQEQNEAEPEVKQPESKTEVIDRLKELAKSDKPVDKNELEQLKKAYYRFRHAEVLKEREAFLNGGGAEDDFMPQPDTDEESFKAEMSLVKEKRAKQHEALEQQKRENLQKKQQILEEIKKLSSSPEEANKNYEQFRKLQAEWRETNPVPAENATDLWKSYQLYVEQFYDLLKLNSEFREYDFKKNYEAKIHLCEAAEKLLEEPDPVSAFHQLQKLHQEFREIGPVAKDLRESVWERFKSASTQINKHHQEYYEKIKAREEENLVKKTALCEKVEGFELDKLKSFADWDKVTKEIIAIQAEWKTIGFTPKNMNAKIFERFRKACDAFFKQKSVYLKSVAQFFLENEQEFLQSDDVQALRKRLLAVKGVGNETADSILLYAFHKPLIVIDAYTRRVAERHLNLDGTMPYGQLQKIFMDALPIDVSLYGEYHALIVALCKQSCLKSGCGEVCSKINIVQTDKQSYLEE